MVTSASEQFVEFSRLWAWSSDIRFVHCSHAASDDPVGFMNGHDRARAHSATGVSRPHRAPLRGGSVSPLPAIRLVLRTRHKPRAESRSRKAYRAQRRDRTEAGSIPVLHVPSHQVPDKL